MSETISETVNIVASVLYVVSKVHCGVEICRVCYCWGYGGSAGS